jgi:hypothetical protein
MPLLEFLIQIKIDFTNTNLLKRRISSIEQEVASCVDVVNGASATNSGGNSLFPGGAKPSKFPTKLSNFRQTPTFALEKAVFSPFIGQNFRKFVIFHEGGGRTPPLPTEISATGH